MEELCNTELSNKKNKKNKKIKKFQGSRRNLTIQLLATQNGAAIWGTSKETTGVKEWEIQYNYQGLKNMGIVTERFSHIFAFLTDIRELKVTFTTIYTNLSKYKILAKYSGLLVAVYFLACPIFSSICDIFFFTNFI